MYLTEDKLRKIIQEELGIATEVSKITEEVFQSILLDIRNRKPEKNEICFTKNGVVECIINNTPFKVNYTCRNFLDKNVIDNFDIDYLTEGGTLFFNKNFFWVNVNLIAVNGTIFKQEAVNTIQHEMEHVFQQLKCNKRIPSNDLKYAKIKTDLNGNNTARKNVARLVYLTLKSEQEGFINGTYAWCMTNDLLSTPYTYDNIKNSPSGVLYNEMVDLYNIVFNDIEMTNIIKTEYKLSKNKISKLIHDFLKRIGKILIKVNQDKSKFWRI